MFNNVELIGEKYFRDIGQVSSIYTTQASMYPLYCRSLTPCFTHPISWPNDAFMCQPSICRKCGAIINMSSSAGQLPTPQMTVYAATKVVCLFVLTEFKTIEMCADLPNFQKIPFLKFLLAVVFNLNHFRVYSIFEV